jgi:hypothetical protein
MDLDPDPDPDPAISSLTFKTPTKNYFFSKIIFLLFTLDKKLKRSQKTVEIKVFLTIFA